MKHTLLLICLLPLLCSCRGGSGHQQLLNALESTWHQCEDSLSQARREWWLLADSMEDASEYARRKFDLLSIRLRDKQDIIPSSPDSALLALSYFKAHGNNVDRMRAYYYAGSAYRDLKDYPRAVPMFLCAVELAGQHKSTDTLIWQNSLSQLRYLYMLQLLYDEALDMALRSVALARETGKNVGWCLTNVASSYKDLGDSARCLLYCDSAYETIRREHFPSRYASCISHLLSIYTEYHRTAHADTLLCRLSRLPENSRPRNFEFCLAQHFEHAGDIDSAILHYRKCYAETPDTDSRYEASAGLQRCYMRKGDSHQALLWARNLYDTNDSIITQYAFRQTQLARSEYLYHRDKEAEQANKRKGERMLFALAMIAVCLFAAMMTSLALYYRKKKIFCENMSAAEDKIQKQSEELQTRRKRNEELNRIALMKDARRTSQDIISLFLQASVGQAHIPEGAWEELISMIESLHPNFIEDVQQRMRKGMREELLRTICLLKIGMKPAQIASVMDANIKTVCHRVNRAKELCGDLLEAPKQVKS